MDFWKSFGDAMDSGLGEDRLFLGTAERKNASLSAVQGFSRNLDINEAFVQRNDPHKRYIIAVGITHDLLLCAYNVDNGDVFAARISRLPDKKGWQKLNSKLAGMRARNLELRLIGLQNAGTDTVRGLQVELKVRGHLVEVDLFGANMRNVAIDTKTGMTYNVLLLNRIYRAGELANTVSREDFETKLGELSFV